MSVVTGVIEKSNRYRLQSGFTNRTQSINRIWNRFWIRRNRL